MHTQTLPLPTWSSIDGVAVRRLAQRLEHELATILAAVPPEHRTVSGLSRWTQVARPICHRVIAAARPRSEPLEILFALPGVQGVEQTVLAIAGTLKSREIKTSALQAVACYKELVGLLGGSQSKARIAVRSLTRETWTEPADALRTRRASFEAASELARARSDAQIMIQCMTPKAGHPGVVSSSMFVGQSGLRLREGHIPVLVTWEKRNSVDGQTTVGGQQRVRGLNPAALLDEFSSDPFPRVVTRGDPGFETDVMDFDTPSGSGETTFFITSRTDGTIEPWGLEFHILPRLPSARLVMDLLVHKDLALGGPAQGSAYFVGVNGLVRGDGAARWFDRVGNMPAVAEITDPAAALSSVADVSPRHRQMLEKMCHETGVTLTDVRWLRWDVPWPLWGCDHVLRVKRG